MAQVLRELPQFTDPNLLVGSDHFDDAGVYRISADTALVTTLDFFPPLVDDPFAFGQIAAANSLSDVYAMGGRPLTALNIVGFPDKQIPLDVLGTILSGGAERVKHAGAVIAGGHSVRDAEIKYGLSVTGVVHPDRILTNGAARPGDVLILSKPIGSGTLTTAAKQGKIAQDDLAQAIEVMIELNATACAAAVEVGVHSVTDITGFGLLGHATEMADASEVSLEIAADQVPLLDDARALAKKGVLTRAYKATLAHLGDKFSSSGVDETLVHLLADAQTSGGLLIAVAQEKADRLVELLVERDTSCAAVIGQATPRSAQAVVLA